MILKGSYKQSTDPLWQFRIPCMTSVIPFIKKSGKYQLKSISAHQFIFISEQIYCTRSKHVSLPSQYLKSPTPILLHQLLPFFLHPPQYTQIKRSSPNPPPHHHTHILIYLVPKSLFDKTIHSVNIHMYILTHHKTLFIIRVSVTIFIKLTIPQVYQRLYRLYRRKQNPIPYNIQP